MNIDRYSSTIYDCPSTESRSRTEAYCSENRIEWLVCIKYDRWISKPYSLEFP